MLEAKEEGDMAIAMTQDTGEDHLELTPGGVISPKQRNAYYHKMND
jgi:hypothetical protein